MAKTGETVTVSESRGGLNWTGYVEPEAVCWQTAPLTSTTAPKNLDQLPVLASTKAEVNGDQHIDQFQVIETKDNFLVLLRRGIQLERISEGCGGGGGSVSNEESFKREVEVIGTIAKNQKQKQTVNKLEWKTDQLIVSGLGVYQAFKTAACLTLTKESDPTFVQKGCIY